MITVKDIREKDFSLQKRGYSEDEVDDFLDEIADQLGSLIRDNREYLARAEQAEAQRDEAYEKLEQLQNAAAPAPAPVPAPVQPLDIQAKPSDEVPDGESAYFDNLKTALREALLSAQRIADDTVSEAKKKAEEIIGEADDYAKKTKDSTVTEAENLKKNLENEVEDMKTQLQTLKQTHEGYKTKFVEMVKSQLKALGEDDDSQE